MISLDFSTRTQLRAMISVIGYKLSMSKEKKKPCCLKSSQTSRANLIKWRMENRRIFLQKPIHARGKFAVTKSGLCHTKENHLRRKRVKLKSCVYI